MHLSFVNPVLASRYLGDQVVSSAEVNRLLIEFLKGL